MATASTTARKAKAASAAASDTAYENAEKTIDAMKAHADRAREAAFSMSPFEVPEVFRTFAEQGLTQSREAYDKMRASAEEATGAIEESFEATRSGMIDIQTRSMDAAKESAEAAMELAKRLSGVTSFAEAIEIQTAFARERFEAMLDYSKTVQATLARTATDASAPGKAFIEKSVSRAA